MKPRRPFIDSPFLAAFFLGGPGDTYTANIRAVTPSGVLVTGKCCIWGHTSADGAMEHAAKVRRRIEETGR